MTKVLTILAEGFEETEAIIPVDVLRRLNVEVVTAGLTGEKITGAHNVAWEADTVLENTDITEFDAVILPGGMPGSANLRESDKVMEVLKKASEGGKLLCAICAAPIALGRAGLIKGKKVTAYPGFEKQLEGAEYTGNLVEKDGNVITGKGPGAAFKFAYTIAGALGLEKEAAELYPKMFVSV